MNRDIGQPLKLIAKTSLVVLIALFLSKLFTYIFRIIVARYYGPEEYGLFSLGLMIVGFFVAVSSLGLVDGILRYVSIYRGSGDKDRIFYIFKFSLLTLIISSLISGLILFLTAKIISINIFHNENLIIYLKSFSVLIPITILANLFLSIIRAYENIKWYSFIQNILQNLSKVVLLAVLIFLGLKTNAIIFSRACL
mgnify:FL=1